MKRYIRVMFICHGNICRSPMAEFCLKDLSGRKGLTSQIHAASAATSTEEIWNGIGNPVYPPAREELARHGISCDGKRAVQVTKEDYGRYDYMIGMDSGNIRNMLRIFGGDPAGKIYKMMEFAGEGWRKLAAEYDPAGRQSGNRLQADVLGSICAADVADPWYTGNFAVTWENIADGCQGLLKYLEAVGELQPRPQGGISL